MYTHDTQTNWYIIYMHLSKRLTEGAREKRISPTFCEQYICMLTQVYERLLAQLHILSINLINVLSYYRCIRYLMFPALFSSISMVYIDYSCITSVREYSKSIRLLLKWFKVLFYGRLHYFSGPYHVCYPKNSIKHSRLCLQQALFILICMLAQVYVLFSTRLSTMSLPLSHWYPGSGVVLDCIDSWSLHPYLLYLF